jgi:hypothetical protein
VTVSPKTIIVACCYARNDSKLWNHSFKILLWWLPC